MFLLVVLLVVVAGAALSMVEAETAESIQDGIWWALVTVTTVGYGDVVPDTLGGRAIAAVVMLVGIGFVAALTATIAATFVKQDERPDELWQQLDEIASRSSGSDEHGESGVLLRNGSL